MIHVVLIEMHHAGASELEALYRERFNAFLSTVTALLHDVDHETRGTGSRGEASGRDVAIRGMVIWLEDRCTRAREPRERGAAYRFVAGAPDPREEPSASTHASTSAADATLKPDGSSKLLA